MDEVKSIWFLKKHWKPLFSTTQYVLNQTIDIDLWPVTGSNLTAKDYWQNLGLQWPIFTGYQNIERYEAGQIIRIRGPFEVKVMQNDVQTQRTGWHMVTLQANGQLDSHMHGFTSQEGLEKIIAASGGK